jgi:hypothetical protein
MSAFLKERISNVESEEGILGKHSLPNNQGEKKGGLNWH